MPSYELGFGDLWRTYLVKLFSDTSSLSDAETVFAFEKMSPASKSKPKDKKSSKEPQKISSKPSGSVNGDSGIPASAYNPLSVTFQTLVTMPTSPMLPLQTNCRFVNIDDIDNHVGVSPDVGVDYDSVSNTGSEEYKEKISSSSVRQETVPGAENDKREKVRQKNERKHQRQKEKRAQELHERCSGYLMSRKLEALAQQLVAMGFSHERATMALMLNEGKVEESVSWLFEEGEDADKHKGQEVGGSNLKIDISEELSRIADMEIKYKCMKQEVERAVIMAEGDLKKASESLRSLKLDSPSTIPKPEGSGDPPVVGNEKLSVPVGQSMARQPKSNPVTMIQQRRDDRDFNYTKTAVSVESGGKNVQPLKRMTHAKLEWPKPRQTALPSEKRSPSVSYPLASPLEASPPFSRTEMRYVAVGSETKNVQPGAVREPIVTVQSPQSVSGKQVPAVSLSSSPLGVASCWYPTNSVDVMKVNGITPHIPFTRNLNVSNASSNPMIHQLQFHKHQHLHYAPNGNLGDYPGTSGINIFSSRTNTSPTLAAASSLGLFSGLGSNGSSESSSPIDWSTGSLPQLDYTSIDWSLNPGLPCPDSNGLWAGPGSLSNGALTYNLSGTAISSKSVSRSAPSSGLQENRVSKEETSGGGSQEWTSPFEEKDLFSLPKPFVSSLSH